MALDTTAFPESAPGERARMDRRRNQLRTRDRFTHLRYNLLREAPADFANLQILLRQLLYVVCNRPEMVLSVVDCSEGAAPSTIGEAAILTTAFANKKDQQPNAQAVVKKLAAQTKARVEKVLDEDLLMGPDVELLKETLVDQSRVFAPLTEESLIKQIGELVGASNLALGRVAGLILDVMGQLISEYKMPVNGLGVAGRFYFMKKDVHENGQNNRYGSIINKHYEATVVSNFVEP